MAISMNTNISAMTAQRNLNVSSSRSASSLSKLSSGSRVPTAKEDAAALSIGSGLRRDVSALKAAQVNAQQGTSMLQIADGAFGQIGDILVRMKSLASSAMSEQLSSTELGYLDTEYTALRNEIDRIAGTSEFNGVSLLGGSSTKIIDTQGANVAAVDGFVAFEFDDSKVANGDTFQVFYDDAANGGASGTLTIQNVTKSLVQTITLGATGDEIVGGPGNLKTFNFDDIGVKVTLSDDFNTSNVIGGGADIGTAAGTLATEQFAAQDGTAAAQADLDFHVGIDASTGVAGDVNVINIAVALGSFQELINTASGDGELGTASTTISSINSLTNAREATQQIDGAIYAVNSARSSLGSAMNRLEFAEANISVAIENTEAARSAMMDVDVSAEMTTFTSQQVLIQAGVSMLAQANQQPSLLLRLLQ